MVTMATAKRIKKTKLELEFDRCEQTRVRDDEKRRKRELTLKIQEEKSAAIAFKREAKELIAVFRKKTPISIKKTHIEFVFRGLTYTVRKTDWSLGGHDDVDSYQTQHKGWKIFGNGDNWGHILYEIEEYSSPLRLKPSPEDFCDSIIHYLREVEDRREKSKEPRDH